MGRFKPCSIAFEPARLEYLDGVVNRLNQEKQLTLTRSQVINKVLDYIINSNALESVVLSG